ncbi:hypothetical protein [Pontibacter cellulosilyticus]|uniref:Uncharacterized protein n=1 Tax=Pontibacter cellulosilyticus TaxID=1720253 RepID=A0A923SI75_9BACT|nr:hypothetical protein [Pontibacter cellulosilyticus]MBC5992317.1 hypothetical protein [Pontibacter cellulosilyticus]
MGEPLLLPQNLPHPYYLEAIHQSLEVIQQQLLNEVKVKQEAMHLLVERMTNLENTIEKRDQRISELTAELELNRRMTEGNRQIVNKLLNDIDRLQQDIEWYKRTYESRSLLGTLKEKIFGTKKLI